MEWINVFTARFISWKVIIFSKAVADFKLPKDRGNTFYPKKIIVVFSVILTNILSANLPVKLCFCYVETKLMGHLILSNISLYCFYSWFILWVSLKEVFVTGITAWIVYCCNSVSCCCAVDEYAAIAKEKHSYNMEQVIWSLFLVLGILVCYAVNKE